MKKILLPLFAFILSACSAAEPTPAPTATAAPTLTATATFTASPTVTPAPTETATPLPTPPIETVPFNEKTYKNLPQVDVAAWVKETGRIIAPKDIIEAAKLGENPHFPSDALIVGFHPSELPNGAIIMDPIVKLDEMGRGGVTAELPITFEAVRLENAKDMIPDGFEEYLMKGTGQEASKWLSFIWRVNTPSGELTGVMLTDGVFLTGEDGVTNRSEDMLKWTRGEGAMLMPMTKMPDVRDDCDAFGSVQAKWTAISGFIVEGRQAGLAEQNEIKEVMSEVDLRKEEDFNKLQELLNKYYLFMGKTEDQFIQIAE